MALSYERGAEVALAAMKDIDVSALAQYQPYHSARADILSRAGQLAAATKAYQQAIECSQNKQERDFLEKQLQALRRRIT